MQYYDYFKFSLEPGSALWFYFLPLYIFCLNTFLLKLIILFYFFFFTLQNLLYNFPPYMFFSRASANQILSHPVWNSYPSGWHGDHPGYSRTFTWVGTSFSAFYISSSLDYSLRLLEHLLLHELKSKWSFTAFAYGNMNLYPTGIR